MACDSGQVLGLGLICNPPGSLFMGAELTRSRPSPASMGGATTQLHGAKIYLPWSCPRGGASTQPPRPPTHPPSPSRVELEFSAPDLALPRGGAGSFLPPGGGVWLCIPQEELPNGQLRRCPRCCPRKGGASVQRNPDLEGVCRARTLPSGDAGRAR